MILSCTDYKNTRRIQEILDYPVEDRAIYVVEKKLYICQ